MSKLKLYFHRFGYLLKGSLKYNTMTVLFSNEFDEELDLAVFEYQKMLGLQATRKLDKDTIETIMVPKCRMSDASPGTRKINLHTAQHFSFFGGKPRWMRRRPMYIFYAFSDHDIDYLTSKKLKTILVAAFARWSAVIPVYIHHTNDHQSADITVGFFRCDLGDGESFNIVLGVLGHAFSPKNGHFHLGAAERWAVDFMTEKMKMVVDLESVATHEIGHVLGLAHSSVKEAIMYLCSSPQVRRWI